MRFVGGREGGQTEGGGCLLRLVVVACYVVGAFWVGLGVATLTENCRNVVVYTSNKWDWNAGISLFKKIEILYLFISFREKPGKI